MIQWSCEETKDSQCEKHARSLPGTSAAWGVLLDVCVLIDMQILPLKIEEAAGFMSRRRFKLGIECR